jgi:hypothetical protein
MQIHLHLLGIEFLTRNEFLSHPKTHVYLSV